MANSPDYLTITIGITEAVVAVWVLASGGFGFSMLDHIIICMYVSVKSRGSHTGLCCVAKQVTEKFTFFFFFFNQKAVAYAADKY